mgnify:FL=1
MTRLLPLLALLCLAAAPHLEPNEAYAACQRQIAFRATQNLDTYWRCWCQDVPGQWMVCDVDTTKLFEGLHPEQHGFRRVEGKWINE